MSQVPTLNPNCLTITTFLGVEIINTCIHIQMEQQLEQWGVHFSPQRGFFTLSAGVNNLTANPPIRGRP